MSFCCADLFKLKHFKQVRLAARERGLYRQISWPFICTTPTISQWLHGGELLFISNAGPDTDEADLLALARESFEKALSGMVLLTGGDYISAVPDALTRFCDEAAFPLFDMPWDSSLSISHRKSPKRFFTAEPRAKRASGSLNNFYFLMTTGAASRSWPAFTRCPAVRSGSSWWSIFRRILFLRQLRSV